MMRKYLASHLVSVIVTILFGAGSLAQAQLRYQSLGQPTLDKQTGLYKQQVEITNESATEQADARLFVEDLPGGVTLWNGDGEEDGLQFTSVPTLAAGESTTLTLEYYDPTRIRIDVIEDFSFDAEFRFSGLLQGEYRGHFGDMDADDRLTANDVMLIDQHIGRSKKFETLDLLDQADFNHDGEVDRRDSALVAQAAMQEQLYPSLLHPDSGGAGTIVELYHPSLANVEADVEVEVAGLILPDINQTYPGVIKLMIPPQLSAGQSVDVTLRIDGVERFSGSFQIEDIPTLDPVAFRQNLARNVDEFAQAKAEFDALLDDTLENQRLSGFYDELDAERIILTVGVVNGLLLETAEEMRDMIDSLPDEAMPYFMAGVYSAAGAQDFQQFTDGLQQQAASLKKTASSAKSSFPGFGSDDLEFWCGVEETIDLINLGTKWVGYGCAGLSAVSVAAFFVPAVGAVVGAAGLATAVGLCAKFSVANGVKDLLFDLVPKIDETLLVSGAAYATGTGDETQASFTVRAQVHVLGNFCVGRGEALVDFLIGKAIEKAILKSGVFSTVYREARALFPSLMAQIDQEVAEQASNVVGAAISATGLDGAMDDIVERSCGLLSSGTGTDLVVDPADLTLDASPNMGSFQRNATDVTFVCPDPASDPPAPGEFTIRFGLAGCHKPKEATATVQCEPKQQVTFTIGDNGNLLDDIFELSINGDTILTSNSPVTSINTTLDLAQGEHTMQMYGRAAPDGIGTYFVSVDGARIISGPPPSGSDLSAGLTFTWTIVVE